MTEVAEEAREGSPPPAASPEAGPQCAQRAKSITQAAPASPVPVTQRTRNARRAVAAITAVLDRPGSLVHAQPPTFAQARHLHHKRANRWNAPAARYPRLVWGYFHLIVIAAPLRFAEWVTETPLRLTGLAALITVVWIWS